MPRRKTDFKAGESYHVYNRGNNREKIFFDRDNYLFFLRKVRAHLSTEICNIIAYCLMPNHYHLLVRLLSDNFSGAMKAFGISYSKTVNKRLTRVGPLFQGPFQAIHVDKEDYLLQLSRYIHLNPVQAQLCPSPEAWEFSSYRDFIGQRNGSLAMKDIVVDQFSSPQAYAEFVLAGIGKSDRKIKHLVIDD